MYTNSWRFIMLILHVFGLILGVLGIFVLIFPRQKVVGAKIYAFLCRLNRSSIHLYNIVHAF